jgi:hypothetical protein
VKIQGLDKLTRQLDEAQKAFKDIDGEIGSVSFDPMDPGSIEAAIHQMEALIDERLARYASNPLVGPMAEEIRENFRQQILDKAAQARLEGKND